jgi:hypothetical protein
VLGNGCVICNNGETTVSGVFVLPVPILCNGDDLMPRVETG